MFKNMRKDKLKEFYETIDIEGLHNFDQFY